MLWKYQETFLETKFLQLFTVLGLGRLFRFYTGVGNKLMCDSLKTEQYFQVCLAESAFVQPKCTPVKVKVNTCLLYLFSRLLQERPHAYESSNLWNACNLLIFRSLVKTIYIRGCFCNLLRLPWRVTAAFRCIALKE